MLFFFLRSDLLRVDEYTTFVVSRYCSSQKLRRALLLRCHLPISSNASSSSSLLRQEGVSNQTRGFLISSHSPNDERSSMSAAHGKLSRTRGDKCYRRTVNTLSPLHTGINTGSNSRGSQKSPTSVSPQDRRSLRQCHRSQTSPRRNTRVASSREVRSSSSAQRRISTSTSSHSPIPNDPPPRPPDEDISSRDSTPFLQDFQHPQTNQRSFQSTALPSVASVKRRVSRMMTLHYKNDPKHYAEVSSESSLLADMWRYGTPELREAVRFLVFTIFGHLYS